MMVDSALFHYRVGSMAGFDFWIYRKIPLCYRAVIYVVITLAVTDKTAIVF